MHDTPNSHLLTQNKIKIKKRSLIHVKPPIPLSMCDVWRRCALYRCPPYYRVFCIFASTLKVFKWKNFIFLAMIQIHACNSLQNETSNVQVFLKRNQIGWSLGSPALKRQYTYKAIAAFEMNGMEVEKDNMQAKSNNEAKKKQGILRKTESRNHHWHKSCTMNA